jgi:hypothetical protein
MNAETPTGPDIQESQLNGRIIANVSQIFLITGLALLWSVEMNRNAM